MAHDAPLRYTSGDLEVRLDRGEIRHAEGGVERLTPVNSRVLAMLLSRSGRLVTRSELFEAVWRNQLVNDDVLTRSVSDIRAALRRLSGSEDHIETVPKRGYVWVAPACKAEHSDGDRRAARNGTDPVRRRLLAHGGSSALVWTRRLLGYSAGLVGLAVLSGWLTDLLVMPPPPIVAVLPVISATPNPDLVDRIEREIVDFLVQNDDVDVLGATARNTSLRDPIPGLFSAFGARWIVEGEVIQLPSGVFLDIALIDARTGTIDGSPKRVEIDDATLDASLDRMLLELEEAITLRMGR